MLTRVTEIGMGRRWVLMASAMPMSREPILITEPRVP